VAHENAVRTIAFPAISCGIYGYPIPDAARIAVREANRALGAMPEIERILFTCFGDDVFDAYQAALKRLADDL
jgi:O-acetyl-ADP-ribose deacetylase (regulator of RNase III)